MPATTTRDYLFRALYLRREMLIVAAENASDSGEASSNKDVAVPEPSAASVSAISLRDALLLPPLYGVEGLSSPPPSSYATIAGDPMLTLDHAWKGLVHIRGPSSPWYRGCFSFYVYFPSRYPFEPPIIELTGPLRSHPLVQERRVVQLDHLANATDPPSEVSSSHVEPLSSAVTHASTTASAVGRRVFVPFEDVYAALDPMKTSVMAALLRHVLRLFYPQEWTPAMEASIAQGSGQAAAVNRVLARRDVERRSVTQEVALGRPFEQYVHADVMEHFLQLWDTVAGGGASDVSATVAGSGADWYTREVLPHLLHS